MRKHSFLRRQAVCGAAIVTVLLLLCIQAIAQQPFPGRGVPGTVFNSPPPGDMPGMDSSLIYRAFFKYHHNLSSWIDSQSVGNALRAQALSHSAATLYHVPDADYPTVVSLSHSVAASIAQVETEAATYVRDANAKNATLVSSVLKGYEQRRQRILSDAVRQLQTTLTPNGWQGLHTYLNDEFRKQIHAATSKKP